MVCIFLFYVFLNLFLGYQYEDDCNVNAANFLLLGGGIVLAISALNVVICCCCDGDILAIFLTPLACFAHFVVMIWGTITIFGK